MDPNTARFRKSPRIDPNRPPDFVTELQSSEKVPLQDPRSYQPSTEKEMSRSPSPKSRVTKSPPPPGSFVESAWRVVKTTLGCSYTTYFLPFVFLGIVAGHQGWDDSYVFLLNFLAIIPLASLLSFATEELAKSVGQTIGGLINATFGNAVEMIVRSQLDIGIRNVADSFPNRLESLPSLEARPTLSSRVWLAAFSPVVFW